MRAAVFTLCLLSAPVGASGAEWKFDFGGGTAADGYLAVSAGDAYDAERGCGFEAVGAPRDVSRKTGGPLESDFVSGADGFRFSVRVPEGCHEVLVTLGDPEGESVTTVKSESRRLMLENVATARGEMRRERFTVHVRRPDLPDGGRVRLKDREKDYLHWDDKLTLEFVGSRPCVAALEIRSAPGTPVVHLLGDSTVTDQPFEPWNSWGQMLPRFLKPGIAVANHAESGESIRSSLGALRFEKVWRTMRRGDHVVLQFGHNDMKDKSPGALERYRENLLMMVGKVRELGGHPVLVTSMERKAGVKEDTLAGYPDAVRSVARETGTPLIDLHAMSRTLYRALGPDLGAAFQDGTHHNNFGSYELAKCVAAGIRDGVPTLAEWLRPGTAAFDPAEPGRPGGFKVPASPVADRSKPDGD